MACKDGTKVTRRALSDSRCSQLLGDSQVYMYQPTSTMCCEHRSRDHVFSPPKLPDRLESRPGLPTKDRRRNDPTSSRCYMIDMTLEGIVQIRDVV